MKKGTLSIGILILSAIGYVSFCQNGLQGFVLSGTGPETIAMNQTFSSDYEIFPFGENVATIFGLAVSASFSLENDNSLVRIILVDKNYEEYLIYEAYSLLYPQMTFSADNICEETCILYAVDPYLIRIEITSAAITINSLTYTTGIAPGTDLTRAKNDIKRAQNIEKINRINKTLNAKGLSWIAGPTPVAEMTYAEKMKLYGQSTFPNGFEYYVGGVIQVGEGSPSRETSLMVSHWDWRDRHGQNWITSVKNQASCGSCWAFAATGATEALTNLFFNQHLNLNLSEQDVLSCSGAGSCSGGYPSIALNYITSTGVVDEATFPYTATDQPCSNKGDNPSQLIKIGGKIDFGSSQYPRTEDDLKRMIIERGPLSGGLYDWSHAMVLPGYMVVEEGDVFYYRNLNLQTYWKTVGAGDPLIGKTVWIFKNSWGSGWGDDGYVYVETTIGNFGWTHALLTPVQSLVQTYGVQCVDNDGDEYYWWGLGDKPSTCDCPDQPDGDDSDPTLGPLDQYGNCAILGGPPVANFTGNPTDIMEGQSVTFTDLSINNPTSWLWSFPGGVPLESTEQHPVVVYPAIGTYDVTLTVANDEGSDVMTITGYIHVTEYVITYCSSSGTSTAREWIQTVNMDSFTNNSGSDGGYGDYTGSSISVESGQSVPVTLTPGFSVNSRREFWRIWIDFNIDGDFTDPGEQVFAADNTKNTVTGSISIPSDVSGETRMRVSMKNNAAPTSCEQFSNGEVEDYTLVFGTPGPQPPVADFSGTPTTVSVGNSVQFTDLSENNPTSWSWTFDGGTPATSTDPDPTVTYNTEGTYDVMLTVTNAMGSDTKIITGYIIVIAGSTYCSSQSSSNDLDWIAQVQIGDDFTYASEASLYSDFTGQTVDLTPGSAYNITLTPYFTGQDQHEFWRVWIDYNGDGDFEDSGETVFSANNKKTVVTGTISIPTTTPDQTRMRITMKNGSSPSPCETFPNGEVEDYTASFISGPASLGNEDHFDLTIYPNPATSMLYIHLISNTEAVKIKVYNSLGGIMDEFDVKGMTMQIDLGNYPDGLYYLGAERGKEILFKRFVKN